MRVRRNGILLGIASIASLLIAIAATAMLAIDLTSTELEGGWGYPALGFISVFGAWGAFAAWVSDKRLLAVPGHLLSVFAPWGYLYPIPLVAILLAIAAGATFKSSRDIEDPFLTA